MGTGGKGMLDNKGTTGVYFKVNEIFKSIEGEGIRTGIPVTFIRLYGCNLNCSYCDTRYACEGEDYKNLEVQDIINEVRKLGLTRITLTGGEPLLHANIELLIEELVKADCEVNIETNGSIHLQKLPLEIRKKVIFTMDWKSPSSGMNDKMRYFNLDVLESKDVLKFVVGSMEDLDEMKEIITDCLSEEEPLYGCNVFVSPVFGKIELEDIAKYVIDNNLTGVRVQIQLHKVIWEPNRRGV